MDSSMPISCRAMTKGMRELADDARFTKEARASFPASKLRGEELDGHGAVDQGIVAAHDAAACASAERFEDLIAAYVHGVSGRHEG